MKLLTKITAAFLFNAAAFALPAYAQHDHEDDAELGQWEGQLVAVFDSDEVFSLAETSGLLTGWAGDAPGFLTVEEDEPDEGLLMLDPTAVLALEVVNMDPGFKAHTPGFANVLAIAGDTWTIGSAPFDDHPTWHIDSTDAGFDPAQTEWTGVFRIIDLGPTGYAASETFTMTFTNLPPQRPFVRGDINADGTRDLADAIFALDILFGDAEAGECEDALDANDDGAIDLGDPIALLSSLFGSQSTPLVGPGPECGDDGTADDLFCEEHDACL